MIENSHQTIGLGLLDGSRIRNFLEHINLAKIRHAVIQTGADMVGQPCFGTATQLQTSERIFFSDARNISDALEVAPLFRKPVFQVSGDNQGGHVRSTSSGYALPHRMSHVQVYILI